MKKKSIIEKLRLAFSEEEVKVVLAEVKTADGTTLKASDFKEGEVVSVVSGEGDEMKEEVSPEAEYVLEDGRKITVDAEGKITAIEEAAKEDEGKEAPLEMSAILEAVKESSAKDNEVLMSALDNIAKVVLEQEERIEKFAKAPAKPAKKVDKAVAKAKGKYSALEEIAKHRAAQK